MTVNAQSFEVVNAIGWPGQVDTFRVDLRLRAGAAAGAVAIYLSAALSPYPGIRLSLKSPCGRFPTARISVCGALAGRDQPHGGSRKPHRLRIPGHLGGPR